MLDDKTVLVTGGAGFIGSHVVDEIIKNRGNVIVLDTLEYGTLKNLQNLKDIKFIKGSILDIDLLKKIFKDIDIIVHLAASFGHEKSIEDPFIDLKTNIQGTLNLLNISLNHDIERFIYASSSAVYGDTDMFPLKEEYPTNPTTPYAVSKLGGENYCRAFNRTYGLPTISLRLFNSYGPREYPSKYRGVVARFIHTMLLNKSPTITGDGSETRNYTYVTDTARAHILAMIEKRAISEIFNISTNVETTTLELFNFIKKILNVKLDPIFVDFRNWDVKKKDVDISKAKRILNFEPQVSLVDGLKLTIDWVKNEIISKNYKG